jgi:hypothetical protein
MKTKRLITIRVEFIDGNESVEINPDGYIAWNRDDRPIAKDPHQQREQYRQLAKAINTALEQWDHQGGGIQRPVEIVRPA